MSTVLVSNLKKRPVPDVVGASGKTYSFGPKGLRARSSWELSEEEVASIQFQDLFRSRILGKSETPQQTQDRPAPAKANLTASRSKARRSKKAPKRK